MAGQAKGVAKAHLSADAQADALEEVQRLKGLQSFVRQAPKGPDVQVMQTGEGGEVGKVSLLQALR